MTNLPDGCQIVKKYVSSIYHLILGWCLRAQTNPHTFCHCAGLQAETSPDGLCRHAPLSSAVRNQHHVLLLDQFLPRQGDQLLSYPVCHPLRGRHHGHHDLHHHPPHRETEEKGPPPDSDHFVLSHNHHSWVSTGG